jgi:hypothetical protein
MSSSVFMASTGSRGVSICTVDAFASKAFEGQINDVLTYYICLFDLFLYALRQPCSCLRSKSVLEICPRSVGLTHPFRLLLDQLDGLPCSEKWMQSVGTRSITVFFVYHIGHLACAQLLFLALEMNLSETAFLQVATPPCFALSPFSPPSSFMH